MDEVPAEIADLRRSIDNIDAALAYLLAERFHCTRRVGVIKASAHLPAEDLARERAQIERPGEIARSTGLEPSFTGRFRQFVVAEVIRQHKAIAAAGGDPGVLDTYS